MNATESTNCLECGQGTTDPRHGHPHDYVGGLESFMAGHVCLACNKLHSNQPSIVRLWTREEPGSHGEPMPYGGD
jgi:hypothetical protein